MAKNQILKRDYNLNCNITSLIFERKITTKTLSPKLPTISKETNKLSISNIGFTVNQETIDNALKHINQNNNPNLIVRVRRTSRDTPSDQGPSGENALNKKAKFSYENENDDNPIIDSIETKCIAI
jgi:hypothetical protein